MISYIGKGHRVKRWVNQALGVLCVLVRIWWLSRAVGVYSVDNDGVLFDRWLSAFRR